MSSNSFLTKEQEKRVVEAIAEAENQTSAEIRVHIDRYCPAEPLEQAESIFYDLGMSATALQNGVLIYIATDDRKAAVFGGKGIHTKVEESFWDDVLKILLNHFKNNNYETGLGKAVAKVGNKLKDLYPHRRNDVNELSDEISYNANDEK